MSRLRSQFRRPRRNLRGFGGLGSPNALSGRRELRFRSRTALRAAGHDVLAAVDLGERSVDALLLEMAHQEGRILLTEDKDFGWLAFVAHAESAGVILMRFPMGSRGTLPSSRTRLVEQCGTTLANAFVVLSPGSVRISRSPGRIV